MGEEIRLLGIAGSPRSRSNSLVLLDEAVKGFLEVKRAEVEIVDLSKKKIDHCIACNRCKEKRECILKDDLNQILPKWSQADALLYSSPVYHMSISSKLKACIDRIGHVHFARYERTLPRLCKVGGVLSQGTARYGGQELAIQFLINHLLTMNCLPISGDTPESYMGGPGKSPNWEKGSIREDEVGLATAKNIGKRVAEVTLIVKDGLRANAHLLSSEYSI